MASFLSYSARFSVFSHAHSCLVPLHFSISYCFGTSLDDWTFWIVGLQLSCFKNDDYTPKNRTGKLTKLVDGVTRMNISDISLFTGSANVYGYFNGQRTQSHTKITSHRRASKSLQKIPLHWEYVSCRIFNERHADQFPVHLGLT